MFKQTNKLFFLSALYVFLICLMFLLYILYLQSGVKKAPARQLRGKREKLAMTVLSGEVCK